MRGKCGESTPSKCLTKNAPGFRFIFVPSNGGVNRSLFVGGEGLFSLTVSDLEWQH
jgi:hypothetical protein